MKLICEVAGCGADLTVGTGSHGGPLMCPQCRTSSYYWKKQSLSHMRLRRGKLQLFTARLEHYDPRVLRVINEARKAVGNHNKKAKQATAATTH